jgi:hypothetical protein
MTIEVLHMGVWDGSFTCGFLGWELNIDYLCMKSFLKVFMEFSKVPLASASLAQVHAARTFTGEKVAVKV